MGPLWKAEICSKGNRFFPLGIAAVDPLPLMVYSLTLSFRYFTIILSKLARGRVLKLPIFNVASNGWQNKLQDMVCGTPSYSATCTNAGSLYDFLHCLHEKHGPP